MSTKTRIEWTDATWNPTRGCSRVSEGCRNCYAEKVAGRFSGPGQAYEGLVGPTGAWNGKVVLARSMLRQPLSWRAPRRIFVDSMSDLFHENVPFDFVDEVLAVVALCPHHVFQVLTKRPDRMRDYFARGAHHLASGETGYLEGINAAAMRIAGRPVFPSQSLGMIPGRPWPLPNLWVGVSVEDQASADERIPLLLETRAAVRWISAEPLLGAVNLRRLAVPLSGPGSPLPASPPSWRTYNAVSGFVGLEDHKGRGAGHHGPALDWVVVGGESGPGARPFSLDHARSIIDACLDHDVAVFVKQLGRDPWSESERWSIRGGGIAVSVGADWTFRPRLEDVKGGNPSEWPSDLRIRQFPDLPQETHK